jgi:hypothetical protein
MGERWGSVPSYWASKGKGKRGGGVGEQVYRAGHRWGHSGGAYLRTVCRMPRYRSRPGTDGGTLGERTFVLGVGREREKRRWGR